MITPKMVEEATMNAEKKASAKNDIFAFYVGRKLSYLLTVPFLYINISPNEISLLSIIPLVVGFILCYCGDSLLDYVLAWFCFFLWNLLDGVDGNVARYKKQFSKMGSVYDAMSGYVAMVLSFFGWGIIAAHRSGILQDIVPLPRDLYIVIGALSGLCVIFPRLIMHKALTTYGKQDALNSVKDKSSYSLMKNIALNITSASGFLQVLMILAVIFNMEDLFTTSYFFINMMVMLVSLKAVFKEAR